MSLQETSANLTDTKTPLLSVNGLDLSIGKRLLINNINFSLSAGSCTAIIGPNGAGKTTFLRTLIGLLPCAAGQIAVNGADLTRMDQLQRARCIAYVPQQSQLRFPVPVAAVVGWSHYAGNAFMRRSAESEASIESALHDFDLIALRDKPFDQLSGGEQRRVLLARAAASKAPLILLDEPMAHLDMRYILRLRASLRTLQQRGKTLLMVLHDLRDVEACADQVLLMGEQQIHGPAPLDQLISEHTVQDIYGVAIDKQEHYSFS